MAAPRFNGPNPKRDHERLTAQHGRIYELMQDAVWRTLGEIAEATGDPESSVSAQLRHLRKPRFGAHKVNKNYEGDGLYKYQLVVNEETAQLVQGELL